MSLQSRIDSLKGRHATLQSKINAEDQRPRPDWNTVMKLKAEKLRLKDELERLHTRG